jgi:periplasmic divalent cation tolerance protein
MTADFLIVLCTCPDAATGDRIAQALVAAGLAACVNALPGVVSTYYWEGRVQRDQEVLLLIKSSSAAFEQLRARIAALHPYELPEIVAVPIVRGSAAYLGWLQEALSRTDE